MNFDEKLFFLRFAEMSFYGEVQKNRDIFLHEIFRDGSLSLYEDSMPLTKICDLNCSGMSGLAQIQKFMYTIFKSEGMHSVEAYCLDNMLFYELSKFQVISSNTLWLRAPNLEPF